MRRYLGGGLALLPKAALAVITFMRIVDVRLKGCESHVNEGFWGNYVAKSTARPGALSTGK